MGDKGVQRKRGSPVGESVRGENIDAGKPSELSPELLSQISEQLHFVDLVNGSDASKNLRMQLFGSSRYVADPGRLDDFRQFTCQKNTKSSCEMCGIQICTVSLIPHGRTLEGQMVCC
jgi:hypothetical protein